jgi:hypothetical protein
MINRKGQLQIPYMNAPSKKVDGNVFQAITRTDAVWKQNGEITISFGNYPGCGACSPGAAWSYIGNQSASKKPSMNLGFIDPPYKFFDYKGKRYNVPICDSRNYCLGMCDGSENRQQQICKKEQNPKACGCEKGWVPGATVVHEFGHALGMMHEHQNNLTGKDPIDLNEQAVYDTYREMGMTNADADNNVIDTYDCSDGKGGCDFEGTEYDKMSIMLYYFVDKWINGPNPTRPNFKLSAKDISWLQKLYPLNSKNKPEITVRFVDRDPPAWKMAFVEKTVLGTYGKLIGIKWKFINKCISSGEGSVDKVDDKVVDKVSDVTGTNFANRCNSNAGVRKLSPSEKIESDIAESVTGGAGVGVVSLPELSEEDKKNGAIIGGVIGGVFLLALLIFLFVGSRRGWFKKSGRGRGSPRGFGRLYGKCR